MSEPSTIAEARTAVREPDTRATEASRATEATGATPDAEPRAEELLIEEISIDGMCGVY
jgi:mycofactocin precursor